MNPLPHFLSLLTLQVLVLLFRLHSDYIHLVHLRPDHDSENMASFGPLATPPSSHTPTAATVYGVKRERENDDDDTGQKPAPRKRVTISRKPCIVCTEDTPKNRFPKLPHKQDDNEKHSSDVCFKCFSEHLRVEVETKGHEGVACPQCSKPLEESDIRKLASSWTYREYVIPHRSQCTE